MVRNRLHRAVWVGAGLLAFAASAAMADPGTGQGLSGPSAFLLGGVLQDQPAAPEPNMAAPEEEAAPVYGYRGTSGFFNIREAYSNVRQGEWEVELSTGWATKSDGEDDELEFAESLKYGITDRVHVELEVEQPSIGDGGDSGAGDMDLTFFCNFLDETDVVPALGSFVSMRIPSGDGSSKVDGTFSMMATKTITDRFRFHFQGFIQTANGCIGACDDDQDRRHFQWGVGPGVDYQIAEETLALMNYLHRSSEYYGNHNQNILEFGLVQGFGEIGAAEHGLKLALDVGLDGAAETPNFAANVQYYIEWN